MRGNWKNVSLFEIADNSPKSFVDGDWIESPYITDEGIRLIQTGNIGIGVFKNKNKKFISEKSFKLLKCTEVFPGDVLICRLAEPIGRACIVPENNERYITSVDVSILRVSTKFSKELVHLYLNTEEFLKKAELLSGGSTRQRISRTNLGNIKFNLPPLPQQRKIAQILSTCDAVIEKTDAAIAKYQAMKQGLMHDLFTRGIDLKTGKLRPKQEDAPQLYKESDLGWIPKEWEVKQINEIGEVISGGTPSSNVTEFWNGDIVWITPSDLSKLKKVSIDSSERKISTKGLISSSALLIKKDSIVISSRAPIGYCAVVSTQFTTNQGCKSISFKENHSVYYHYYNLLLNINRIKLKGEGTTFAEISKKELEKIKLSFPKNTKEQEMIALRMKAIEDDIQTEQLALSKYQQLKTGLMQDLLSGKVEVKV